MHDLHTWLWRENWMEGIHPARACALGSVVLRSGAPALGARSRCGAQCGMLTSIHEEPQHVVRGCVCTRTDSTAGRGSALTIDHYWSVSLLSAHIGLFY